MDPLVDAALAVPCPNRGSRAFSTSLSHRIGFMPASTLTPGSQLVQDPRNIITEDAFQLDPALLGKPLARPWRRAAAMAIDGVIVAVLANAPGVLFAVAAALVLIRASARSTRQGYVRTWIRLTLRVWGAVVLFIVVVTTWGKVEDMSRSWSGGRETAESPVPGVDAPHRPALSGVAGLAVATDAIALVGADSEEEARVHAEGLVAADSLAMELAAALAAGDSAAAGSLRLRLATVLAADTLTELNRDLGASRNREESLEERLERAERSFGVRSMLRGIADDLGLGLGWTGLYFTACLALWNDFTPGKRALRIRVIRLDGRQMGWWFSFERFGGYAASLATGLLGFAQILWDRNRQGIHDKITETVVIDV